jgi:tRNA A37 methylthiotransferase MiaB
MSRNRIWQGWRGEILVDEILENNKIQGRNYAYKPVIVDLQGNQKFASKQLLGHHLSVKVEKVSKYSLLGELIS